MPDKPRTMLVKPRKPDMVIRAPRSRIKLPPEGASVPANSYWMRRLGCKDVVKTTAEAIAKGAKQRLAEEAKSRADHMAKPPTKPAAEAASESDQKPPGKGRR